MIWVQHLMGIGHQRRAAAIARALAGSGARVAFVSGGPGAPDVDPDRIRVVALPSARAVDASYRALVDAHGREVDDAWRAARRDTLLAAFAEHAPQVLVTETWPFGRRLLRFELEPLVEHARFAGCRLVSSIRDVLQPSSKPSRARDAADRVLESYDAVLVHGDPAFVGLEASFPETERIRDRIRYTGYVAQGPGPDAPPGVGEGEIVVSAGGGGWWHTGSWTPRSRALVAIAACDGGCSSAPTPERTPWPAGAAPRRRTRSWSRTGPISDQSSRGRGPRSPRRATTPSPTSWPPACRRCWSRSRPKASASSRFGPGFWRRPGLRG